MDSKYFSDYGTGSSSNSTTSWASPAPSSLVQSRGELEHPGGQRSTSFQDLITGKCTLEDIIKELQINTPDTAGTFDDKIWSNQTDHLIGMGPSSAYLRQKSWPEPERTPAHQLPRPASEWIPSPSDAEFFTGSQEFKSSTPVEDAPAPQPVHTLTEEQLRVLNSLPNTVLFSLLQDLEQSRGEIDRRARRYNECRFCKNNGEREAYYRAHRLKDARGRVTCPVLRAFTCARCGARGDAAHTTKYCPLATADERVKSAAMMRSVRMASGRRRNSLPPSVGANDDYVMFGQTTPSVILDSNIYNSYLLTAPLDPSWAALEQKLLL